MTIRRWAAALIAGVMLLGCASAEECAPAPEQTAAPMYAPADMTPEDIRMFVEMMFAAAAGTTAEFEKELRKDMTQEELDSRNAANAAYRARTMPWLTAALSPETLAGEIPIQPEQTQSPEAKPLPEMQTVYTAQDSYAAFAQTADGAEYLAKLAAVGGSDSETSLLIAQEICGMWMAQVKHESLAELNEDYVCWIYAPGTQIDYPIVQGADNSEYLKRMFNGERNSAGTLFIDYRNLPDFQDPNTLIYGHHMRNDSMFGTLTDYEEQAYFEGHPIMLFTMQEEIFLLEIFAGYTTSDMDHCYDIAISDEEDMEAFVQEAVQKSDFVSGAQVKTTDRLATLSTCAYAFEDARYILIGRIVPVWSAEPEEANP